MTEERAPYGPGDHGHSDLRVPDAGAVTEAQLALLPVEDLLAELGRRYQCGVVLMQGEHDHTGTSGRLVRHGWGNPWACLGLLRAEEARVKAHAAHLLESGPEDPEGQGRTRRDD